MGLPYTAVVVGRQSTGEPGDVHEGCKRWGVRNPFVKGWKVPPTNVVLPYRSYEVVRDLQEVASTRIIDANASDVLPHMRHMHVRGFVWVILFCCSTLKKNYISPARWGWFDGTPTHGLRIRAQFDFGLSIWQWTGPWGGHTQSHWLEMLVISSPQVHITGFLRDSFLLQHRVEKEEGLKGAAPITIDCNLHDVLSTSTGVLLEIEERLNQLL
jgi:hypothetical protein